MKRRERKKVQYNYTECNPQEVLKAIGKEGVTDQLKQMMLLRHFEMRAESGYQHGKIGGFFHSYMGQEAIQTGATCALGLENNWWITTYRCHALALLCGCTPKEAMAELYGKKSGCAQGRGGSMHLYADRMLGGFGIVGGHTPIAAGAAFSIAYQKKKGVAVCFLGDGAVAQGAFHEALNLASLWDLPVIYVIENNQWGMGTGVERAICAQPIGEKLAGSYDMKGYSVNGMDFAACYNLFSELGKDTSRPVLVEAITERFRGHAVSDPAVYRSREELESIKTRDPILGLKHQMLENGMLTGEEFDRFNEEQKEIVVEAVKFADESPWPDPEELEEGVYAP
ncbi:MAG: thiamine pyrophosphate-dependent enzyme [Simkaniaceae bacterium]|nr:thiamine pyrophosphate-dependent enzyme [Simkaniaceae bacterium]